MLIVGRFIKAMIVLALLLSGGVILLSASGFSFEHLARTRFGGTAAINMATLLETQLHHLGLGAYQLPAGVLLIILGLMVVFYRV